MSQVSDCVYVSSVTDLLSIYLPEQHIVVLPIRILAISVKGMLKVANIVLEQGYCTLSDAFRSTSPMVKYMAEHARRKMLQMPLTYIRIGDPSKGQSFSILMEKFPGTDYAKLGGIINGLASAQCYKGNTLQKSVVKMLLSIAKSDREQKCLRYTISSGMTPTQARRRYGFQNIQQNTKEVEAWQIFSVFEKLFLT